MHMPAASRGQIRWYVKYHNVNGLSLVRPLPYRLLEIANGSIGAGRYYHNASFINKWRLGITFQATAKENFLAGADAVLTQARSAYLLSHEDQKAIREFQKFYEIAAKANWKRKKTFQKLSELYDSTQESIVALLDEAKNRRAALKIRRLEYEFKELFTLETN